MSCRCVVMIKPRYPCSTVHRYQGKDDHRSFSTTLGALDRDMTKASLTPSSCFDVTFRNLQLNPLLEGKSLCTVVNGAAFQSPNTFRHVTIIVKLAEQKDAKVMTKFTDRF